MNIRRYFGRTSREALAALRRDLGPEAVVLRNQAVEGGVELLALPADALPAEAPGAHEARPAAVNPLPAEVPPAAPAGRAAASSAGAQPAAEMSTLSFQQYVRERLARRASAAPGDADPAPAPMLAQPAETQPGVLPHAQARPVEPQPADAATSPKASTSVPRSSESPAVLAELRELRRFISEQMGALAWLDGARRSAPQARLLASMLGAGFSPALARVVLGRIPEAWDAGQSAGWLRRALAHNLVCDPAASPLEAGGVFALVGPTGVGKTTTTAKLAARFALVHGVGSVGLITLDAYRIGGSDQLRSFGRMLGVPVHVAHDAATLADLLQLFGGRRLVLIDTAGLGQRDRRVDLLLGALDAPRVRRLVVLNATAQVETLDDVVCAYRAQASAGVVVTKVDEAARLGGVLDCALRHRLRLVGVADGQRVPEDWGAPDAQALVDRALAAPAAPGADVAFGLQPRDVQAIMSATAAAGGAHV